MPLNFPDKPEIQLEHPPIAEVICQVKFPAILRIAKSDPVEFQERVRERFPEYGIDQSLLVNPPVPGVEAMSPILQQRVHRFSSVEPRTSITLAPDFYAVATREYGHWVGFVSAVQFAHAATMEVYRPSYISRIGLRYINRVMPSNTGCHTIQEVYELLEPELTAQLRSLAFAAPEEFATRMTLSDGSSRFTLSTAYQSGGKDSSGPIEPSFILDFDCYEEGKLQAIDLEDRLTKYHSSIYKAFRWCFRDEALERFGRSEPAL